MESAAKKSRVREELELRTRKIVALEMVAEKLDEIVGLLRDAGYRVARVPDLGGVAAVAAGPSAQPAHPANTIIVPDVAPPPAQVKNPCQLCGKEAHGTEDMPGGAQRFLCRDHFVQRAKEKQEEAETTALLGPQRAPIQRNVPRPSAPKMLIQAAPAPTFNGAAQPPTNPVLDD